MTGSRTTTGGRWVPSHRVTASMTGTDPSIPILTASISTSSATASSCAERNSTGGTWMSRTPTVFCTTTAVTALIP